MSLLDDAMKATENSTGGIIRMSNKTKRNLWMILQPQVQRVPNGVNIVDSFFNGYTIKYDESVPENDFRVEEALTNG
jgi:hypothetical protein